ncbi:MAG: MarR family transcriptional regulator [Pseudomonadota bacterium]
MMALWEDDGISITKLAERTSLSIATMTPLLKKLELKRLIGFERVTGNDRKKSVALKKKGRALASKSMNAA